MSDWDDLAGTMAAIGINLTADHDVGDLMNLMQQIDGYFAGDLAAACSAIRAGQLAFVGG